MAQKDHDEENRNYIEVVTVLGFVTIVGLVGSLVFVPLGYYLGWPDLISYGAGHVAAVIAYVFILRRRMRERRLKKEGDE